MELSNDLFLTESYALEISYYRDMIFCLFVSMLVKYGLTIICYFLLAPITHL